MDGRDHWHLDKKVPIALIVTLCVQLIGGIWFAGRMVQRDEEQERRLERIEEAARADNVAGRLSTLESQMNDLKAGLYRIDSKLDRLVERKPSRE